MTASAYKLSFRAKQIADSDRQKTTHSCPREAVMLECLLSLQQRTNDRKVSKDEVIFAAA
jgi:hypothetical protein